jgi:hypothetical protein
VEIRLAEIRQAEIRQALARPPGGADCWFAGPRDYFAQTTIAQTKICSGKRHGEAWLVYATG